ncbi:Uncharacterised protein [Vibrio cholerae]|nr:Uncharacterised protein [Vibrio cholerae]
MDQHPRALYWFGKTDYRPRQTVQCRYALVRGHIQCRFPREADCDRFCL